MPTEDILSELKKHLVNGLMFHNQMSEYFSFLGMCGYAEMHRYHELKESAGLKNLTEYHIVHAGELIPGGSHGIPDTIPQQWYRIKRQETDVSWRRRAVKDGMIKWNSWEKDTVILMKELGRQLSETGELIYASIVAEKCRGAENEASQSECIMFDLESKEYDLKEILRDQEKIRKEYREKIINLFMK